MRALPLLLLGACFPKEPEPLPPFTPAAVGVGFDGLLRADGSLSSYLLDGEEQQPRLVLVFISDEYRSASSDAALYANSCAAVAPFALQPASPLPTDDGSALFVSYEATLQLEAHSCSGRVDPERWGAEAEGLWGPFVGARLGYGLGPMTPELQATWSPESLDALGSAMVSSWVALDDAEGNWIASDWTTGILFAVDQDGELQTEPGEEGEALLVPVPISELAPPDALPRAYVQSFPSWFQPLDELGLQGL